MRSLGMQLSGRGTVLSEALLTCAKCHLGWGGDLNFVPDRLSSFAADDEAQWQMDWETSPDRLPRYYVVLSLPGVVEDVSRRYRAPPG